MLSIIIPTLNEKHYLPLLLDSIVKQKLKDYEIIVSMVVLMKKWSPFSIARVLVKKNIFEKLQSYDETMKLSEDGDFVKRALKCGTFGIITSVKVFISDRRFKKGGWMNTIIKYVSTELHTLFLESIKSDIFRYKFNHYHDHKE